VVAAFASMLRRIVFDFDGGDEAWLASLERAGFSTEDIQYIYDSLCADFWLRNFTGDGDAGLAASLDYKLAEQFYTHSWASQEYIPNVLHVTKGSSAGTPMADLVYSMAMSRVFSVLRDTLDKDGLRSVLALPGFPHSVVDVSFVDDVAIPCLGSASEITAKTGSIASTAFSVFRTFGMTLNFKPGKSEAILGFHGPGSRAAKQELTLANHLIPITAGDDTHIRVVSSYQHLGTCIGISVSMCEEVTKQN
jgi:hypothetical protein